MQGTLGKLVHMSWRLLSHTIHQLRQLHLASSRCVGF